MRDLIIFIAWVYINIGSSLLIWRGGQIYRPKDRLIAWALWPLQSWKLKKHESGKRCDNPYCQAC